MDYPRGSSVPWIKLALHTGCRKGELLGLEWQRVDLHQRVIHLEAHHNKSKRRQTIPINEEARNALISRARFRTQYCPSTPWVFADKAGRRIKDIKKGFATACRRAGITDFRPHDLRHTCASWLVMRNVPLATVKAVLRHSSIVVTERYAHLAPESARKALALLDNRDVEPAPEGKTAFTSRSLHVGSAAVKME
jgi:integrase